MTILCHGSTHVYRVGNLHCTCGQAANGYSPPAGVAMYGFPPSYAPAKPAPDVPLHVFKAARDDAKATHLSADGLIAYDERSYGTWRCFWDEETKQFGSWYRLFEGLPADAVLLDKE